MQLCVQCVAMQLLGCFYAVAICSGCFYKYEVARV